MNPEDATPGITRFLSSIQELQTSVIEGQREALGRVAGQMAATIRSGRRIFVFGTGHSHMLAEEGYYRAGGLAPVVPILMSGLMLHENAFLSGRLERLPGLAAPLLDQFNPMPGEMLFVYSNSGVNHMPVEMAMLGRERGLFVVGVLSQAYARVAALSALGKRLDEVVDIALDNGGEPGDALIPLQRSAGRVAASSTIVGALIWNCLITEAVYRLDNEAKQPGSEGLPIFISFNTPGAPEHNRAVIQKWGQLNPYLKAWIPNE
jgi:uncharacterized phosphosugar-binding protein